MSCHFCGKDTTLYAHYKSKTTISDDVMNVIKGLFDKSKSVDDPVEKALLGAAGNLLMRQFGESLYEIPHFVFILAEAAHQEFETRYLKFAPRVEADLKIGPESEERERAVLPFAESDDPRMVKPSDQVRVVKSGIKFQRTISQMDVPEVLLLCYNCKKWTEETLPKMIRKRAKLNHPETEEE